MVTQAEKVRAVREYAVENYARDGWDYVVECWEDDEIAEAVSGEETTDGAIRAIGRACALFAERERETKAEVF